MKQTAITGFEQLMPIQGVTITLTVLSRVELPFFHQSTLTAFLRGLIDHAEAALEDHVWIDSPETGTVQFDPQTLYCFNLFWAPQSRAIGEKMIQRLKQLPDSAPHTNSKLSFRNNLRFCSMTDYFGDKIHHDCENLTLYDAGSLQDEFLIWREQASITLRWRSPVRILKKLSVRKKAGFNKDDQRFCAQADDLDGELFLQRIYDSLSDLIRRRTGVKLTPAAPPSLNLTDVHLFWIEHAYYDEQGQEKPMGGMSGTLSLPTAELPDQWLMLLILGQYYGIGRRRSFGWGRYCMETPDGERTLPVIPRSRTLLQQGMAEHILLQAWRHSAANQDSDLPEEPCPIDDAAPLEQLNNKAQHLLQNTYQTPPLSIYTKAKADGGFRVLSVPPFMDRVMHRAVVEILTPGMNKLMSRYSHGFRRGYSRHTASQQIQRAYREGYRWVFESDIDNFFDCINWNHLFDRLTALYGQDPIVSRIMHWIGAPALIDDRLHPRYQGLPQGAPLSPLLSNLMLDDFDHDMEKAGFRLVRFADDFVVLCKDPQQAKAAWQCAQTSLIELGLQLDPGKSAITPMEKGFEFLGFIFMNDLVINASRDQPDTTPGWLARLGKKPPQPLDQWQQTLLPPASAESEIRTGHQQGQGILLCITGEHTLIATEQGRIIVQRDRQTIAESAWNALQGVILFGSHQLTAPAISQALETGVPIFFASSQGHYRGLLSPGHASKGSQLWLKQAACFERPAQALAAAQNLIKARLDAMRESLRLRQHQHDDIENHIKSLHQLAERIPHMNDYTQLNGLEGAATRTYFGAIQLLLPDAFGFTHRNRRPPKDPFNVLLSIGYTLLYGYVETLLHADGLYPWLGFYHQGHTRHAALASDLMENHRDRIENTALALILRKEISPADFYYDKAGACRINKSLHKKYLAALIQRFETPVKNRQGQTRTLFELLHRQNLDLIDWIEGRSDSLTIVTKR